jgi:hypothetical protein
MVSAGKDVLLAADANDQLAVDCGLPLTEPVSEPVAAPTQEWAKDEPLAEAFAPDSGAGTTPPPAVAESVAAAQGKAQPEGQDLFLAPVGPLLPESTRLRLEVLRLRSQVKKLEAELVAERDYSRALEEHMKTLVEE